MAHVFISYKSQTEAQALKIVERLECAEIDCWIACRDIPVGTDYIDEIPSAIEACTFFVLLISKNMYSSPWVKLELKQAISTNKRILPLILDEHEVLPPYPFMLQNYQVYHIYDDYDGKKFKEVISQIYSVLPELGLKTGAVGQNERPYIYVNYTPKDLAKVIEIVYALNQKGFRTWMDTDLNAEGNWAELLYRKVCDCGCVLAFVSSSAYKYSRSCMHELNLARQKGKKILAVHLDQADLENLPPALWGVQSMNYYDYPDATSFVEELSKAAVLEPRCGIK